MKPLRCVSEGLVQRKTGETVITYPQSEGQETQRGGRVLSDLAYLDKGAFTEAGRLRIDLSPELCHPLQRDTAARCANASLEACRPQYHTNSDTREAERCFMLRCD